MHGEFYSLPTNLLKGHGCKICGHEKRIKEKYEQVSIDFLNRLNKIHNFFYDYSKTVYSGTKNKILVTCPIHGQFHISVGSHLDGRGCQKCGDEKKKGLGGINTKNINKGLIKDILLYVLEIKYKNFIFYKVGLSKNIKNRIYSIKSDLGHEYNVLLKIVIDGDDLNLYNLEQSVINNFQKYSVDKFDGYTECISENPIEFIKQSIINTDMYVTNTYE